MKFKGEPNMLVRITKVPQVQRSKVPKSIRFDLEGIYETENKYLINRLKAKYSEVEEDVKSISYQDLQKLYAEKTGKSAVGVKKADLIKGLEE